MEADLMEKALNAAPWLAPLLIVAGFMRKEIGALLMSGRNESALETLLTRMCDLFEKNLEYFGRVEKGVESFVSNGDSLLDGQKDLLGVQRRILEEMVRDGKRGG